MDAGLVKVLSFLFFIILGYILKRLSILKAETFQVLAGIVMYVTLPCVIITSINGLPIEHNMLLLVVLGCSANLLTIGIGWLANRRKGGKAQAFSMLNLSGYNIGLFAMPFVQSFLSPLGFLTVCLFDAGNAIMCTGGSYGLAAAAAESGSRVTLRDFLKNVFSSAPLCTYLVMIVLAFLHISLPAPVLAFTQVAGNANTFLCMLMIGVSINLHMDYRSFRVLLWHLSVRYGVSILLALAFYFWLPFSLEIRQAMAIIAFAPISAVALIFTLRLKGDLLLAGTINSVSVLLSIFFMTGLLLAF